MPKPLQAQPTLRILLVEDNADTRELMAMYLQQSGHVVTTAGTMQEGANALSVGHFDVLISDLGLPDGSGFDLVAQAPPGSFSRAIAMSGLGRAVNREKSEEAGFQHYLQKPFDPGILDKTLKAASFR